MMKKTESNFEEFQENIKAVSVLLEKYSNYFFYFSPDPDAVGLSIAMSLYLKNMNKDCYIFLPEGFDTNLNFVFEIAKFNNIIIIRDIENVCQILSVKSPLFIISDTATRFLLPQYNRINECKEKYCPEESIEIDHHFGGDSEKIYSNSVPLFFKANSCCEILAEYLNAVEKNINLKFPRNIVLCLLVGICFDTQFGKFVANQPLYEKWFDFLSKRLTILTWENNLFRESKQIFVEITKMSENKLKVINDLLKTTAINNSVGLLILPDVKMEESLSKTGDSTCILSKIVSDLIDRVTEISGNIGVLSFYDNLQNLFFIKVRRSSNFKNYDLRNIEKLLIDYFDGEFQGGGGHPGAVSFRIKKIPRKEFIKIINDFFTEFSSLKFK
jgi:nanoRNase/pAp phosphatase (c-di-AMP/oligoRNAs hydrolase)